MMNLAIDAKNVKIVNFTKINPHGMDGGKKMAKTIMDLHDILFEQLERLNDKSVKGEGLTDEIRRADAISKVAGQLINNGRLVLEAVKTDEEHEMPEEYSPKTKLKNHERKNGPAASGARRPLLNRIT